MKNLYDISWQVTEPEYRQDPALSYSTLAKYEREGFKALDSLAEHIDTPSLTFGSAVDAIITGGEREFNKNFMVADFPDIKEGVKNMVQKLFDIYGNDYASIDDLPNEVIIPLTEEFGFQNNWKPETRAKVIKEQGFEYYKLLFVASGKKILSMAVAQKVFDTVKSLKESLSTSWYFADNNPFDNTTREYQLKFKDTIDGIDYRCMMDLAVVCHDRKMIYPCDLKTTGHNEYDFFNSFIKWRYDIQARLYWNLLRRAMDKDDYFRDFKLAEYRFIVVNKDSLTPLIWQYRDTIELGERHYGKNNDIICRDPMTIGKELKYYLDNNSKVPIGISLHGSNDIVHWLNK